MSLGQLFDSPRTEDLEGRQVYSVPILAELGSLVELTFGGGPTDHWDFAMNYKKEDPYSP